MTDLPGTRPHIIPGTRRGPLCRWDGHSCGGCCNDFTRPREELARVFLQRAALLPSFEKTPEGLAGYVARMGLIERDKECKFLGFLDGGQTSVGCLIHPARMGEELRDAGAFGADLCRVSFCQAALHFEIQGPDPMLRLLATGSDWYDYSRLFSRFFQTEGAIGLLFVLERYTRPLADVLTQRGVRLPRGLTDYALLLARLLGVRESQVLKPGNLEGLAGLSRVPREAIEREVSRLVQVSRAGTQGA